MDWKDPRHFRVPETEIRRRLAALKAGLRRAGVDAMLVVQRVDLFYFSGTAQNGWLFVPAEGEPILLVRRYLPRAAAESPLTLKVHVRTVRELPRRIAELAGGLPETVAFEFDVLPVREFRFYRDLLAPRECVDGSPLVHEVRMIKSEWEIARMEETAAISRRVFDYIAGAVRPGLTEMEFSGMYEAFARKIGHAARVRVRDYQTEGYNWHILSGESGGIPGLLDSPASGLGTSAAVPCGASARRIEANEPIMIDVGTVYNGYHMDETRMFAIGSMPDAAERASRAAASIHDAVVAAARPGVPAGELFRLSVEMADDLGFADAFLGPPGHKVRFVGHGIGLELVEPPFIARGRTERLRSGMTFALEPKMVVEGRFSAGVESVFRVTREGGRLISRIPLETFVCRGAPDGVGGGT